MRGMSEHANIELAGRLLAAFQTGDEAAVDELVHPSYRDHSAPVWDSGPDGVRASIRSMRAALAGRRIVTEDLIASGDRVVARVRLSGGDRQPESERVHIWRVAHGRLAEHWMVPAAARNFEHRPPTDTVIHRENA